MKRIFVGMLILAIVLLAGCQQTQEGTIQATKAIKVGVMLPLTGDAASYGVSVKNAVEFAKKEMNSNIQLVYEDTKCEGKEAVTAMNKLISVDNVAAIIGELCSGATLAAAPLAEQNKVILISPASTSQELTNAGMYIYRTVPSDALQGDFGAKLVYEKGVRKLAVLYSNDDYGVGFNNVLKEKFPALGGEVVISEAVERGVVDLRTPLTKIKEKNPDAIYIISNSPDSAVAALKQITELGITAAVIGSEGLKADYIIENAKEAAEGMIVTSVSSGTTDFVARYKAAGNELGPFAAQGYDAFKAIALAVQQGATSGEQIKAQLDKITFEGASGVIDFDENGDVFGNYEVYKVKDGAFVVSN